MELFTPQGLEITTTRKASQKKIINKQRFLGNTINISSSLNTTSIPYSPHFINISVGTPPQNFTVMFDTGSPTLILIGKQCTTCNFSNDFFNPYNSSTCNLVQNEQYQIDYGSGPVNVTAMNDVTGMLGQKQVPLQSALVTWANFSYGGEFDGIIGAWYSYNFTGINVTPANSFIGQMLSNGVISKNIFSVKALNSQQGRIYIGDYPQYIKYAIGNGTVNSCPLITGSSSSPMPYWVCNLDKITFSNGQSYSLSRDALIDTGTSLIVAPTSDMPFFFNFLNSTGLQCTVDDGDYIICLDGDLTKIPNMQIYLNGISYVLTPTDFLYDSGDGTLIFGIIFTQPADPSDNSWILGDMFLSKYEVVFDGSNNVVWFYSTASYFQMSIMLLSFIFFAIIC